jgi:predicted DCC family thiol-disulfide oxidoreductase YuxK
MKNWSKEDKLVLTTSLITLSCVMSGIFFYVFFGSSVITAIYKGESLEFLNKLIEHHRMGRPYATLEHYFTLSRLLLSKTVIICITIQLLTIAGLKYRYILCRIREFFAAATYPINLAVFRVVLFYTIFTSVDVSSVMWFSQIPAELRVAPQGLGWLLDYLPINVACAKAFSVLLLTSCLTGMIGLCTRTSALLVTVSSFYVLGIPQFYGKVNHYHHLLWFAAILAASRCGDVFSCDAILAAWRRADHGVTDPPGPSRLYALPLRFVWLLMGIIYFFAGFWKVWYVGVDWAWSDNLKFIMYAKWADLGGWTPVFRIDQYPVLCKLAALGAVGFEMSFVFLIFSKRFRLFAPLGGLVFHTMTEIFMRISFRSLLRCYVAFFDWHAIFHHIGRWLYREEMHVLYDGNCKLCRRTMASLRVFDIFGRVTYVNALDEKAIADHGLHWMDFAALLKDMHAVVGMKSWTGFSAYRMLARRIPVLWPAVPLLYLWPIAMVARRVNRHVADARQCSMPCEPSLTAWEREGRLALGSRPVTVIGSLLLLGNIIVGAGDIHFSWPLAAYPSFAGLAGPEAHALEVAVLNATGDVIPLNDQTMRQKMAPERFLGLVGPILSANDDTQRRIRLQALWRLWVHNDASLQQAHAVRFYDVTLITIPERRSENPIRRELLFELPL